MARFMREDKLYNRKKTKYLTQIIPLEEQLISW